MNELQHILTKAEQYLKQQKDLFGDRRYIEKENEAMGKRKNISEVPAEIPPVVTKADTNSNGLYIPEGWQSAHSLEVMHQIIEGCQKCKLWETRTKLVFGTGNPHADIMVIGEAPGADEDAKGEPFVGRAGQLLTKILAAINLKREDVYIANIIKSRPPGNRRPQADEVEACEPYLIKQIELIKPKFMLALGLTAVNTLLRSDYKMGDIRGKPIQYQGATLIPTYHPAALLRNEQWKPLVWEDVKQLRRLYDDYLKTKTP